MPATPKRFAACRFPHRIAVQPLKILTVCAAFALLAIPAGGHAQNSPGAADAQELIRQQQRERQLRDRFERSPDIRLDAPSAAIADAPSPPTKRRASPSSASNWPARAPKPSVGRLPPSTAPTIRPPGAASAPAPSISS
jgi:hypothetical protein